MGHEENLRVARQMAAFLSDGKAIEKSISPRTVKGMNRLQDSLRGDPNAVIYQNGGLRVTPASLQKALDELTDGKVRVHYHPIYNNNDNSIGATAV